MSVGRVSGNPALIHAVGNLLVTDGDGHVGLLQLFIRTGAFGAAQAAALGDGHKGGSTRQLDAGRVNARLNRGRDGRRHWDG